MMDIKHLKGKTRLMLHVQKYFAEKVQLNEKETEFLNINITNLVDNTITEDKFKLEIDKQ